MTDTVHPEASSSDAGSAVDQVADILMGGAEEQEEVSDEKQEVVFSSDDAPDEEVAELDDGDDPETEDSQYDDEDGDEEVDGLAILAGELGLDSDKLTLTEDGEIMVKLKVNGKNETVALQDAIGQTQYYKANEQKAQTLAEERKTFESERQQVADAYNERLNQVQGLGQMLEQQLTAEYQSIDWDRLRVTDPAEWTAKQHEFQKRSYELQQAGAVVGEQMRQATAQQEQMLRQQNSEIVLSERKVMAEIIPEWSDPEAMQAGMLEIAEYARANGIPDDELTQVIHARHVQVLRKAMLYDQGKKVAEKKVKTPPRMQRSSNGQFVSKKKNKLNRLVERAQQAKGANKKEAQADAVAHLLMGE